MPFKNLQVINEFSYTKNLKKIINSYIKQDTPILLKNYANNWNAIKKWNLLYLKSKLNNIKVPLYNNTKSDAYTPVNTADDYVTFDKYVDSILSNEEHKWRLFLFNLYTQAPNGLKTSDTPTRFYGLL